MWTTLDSVEVWTIPDQASLNKRQTGAFDMPAWSFSGEKDARGPEWDRVTVASRLLREIDSLSVR